MQKFTKNHTKFTALQLHSMLNCLINWFMIFYHFLIHNFPPEILTEKKKFSQFHLKDFPYNIWMLMSLWEFFFSISCCATQFPMSTSNVARHKLFSSHFIWLCIKSNVMFWFYFDKERNNFCVTMEIVLWSMKSLRKKLSPSRHLVPSTFEMLQAT